MPLHLTASIHRHCCSWRCCSDTLPVLQGMGKQFWGVCINCVGQLAIGLPIRSCWPSMGSTPGSYCSDTLPVLQGMGKQFWGVCINCVGQLAIGLPISLLLAFKVGWGVEGLLCGLTVGVVLQATAYLCLLQWVDWEGLAAAISAEHRTAPLEGEAGVLVADADAPQEQHA